MPLTIKITLSAASSSSQQHTLTLELTDEANPQFLYTLECSEQDFHILKQEQQLLVDFQAFPQKFVELLDYCRTDNGFLTVLNMGLSNEANFCVVETNQFKALTHLSLKFKQGNDESIKKHLGTRIKEMKSLNE